MLFRRSFDAAMRKPSEIRCEMSGSKKGKKGKRSKKALFVVFALLALLASPSALHKRPLERFSAGQR